MQTILTFIQNWNFILISAMSLTLIFLVHVFRTKKKELPFKYYKSIPNDYSPATVSFLLEGRITTKDITATILYLVEKGAIKYEFEDEQTFYRTFQKVDLTRSEKYLMDFLFDTVGNVNGKANRFSIKDISRYARRNASVFSEKYQTRHRIAIGEARENNFYGKHEIKEKIIIDISLLATMLAAYGIYSRINFMMNGILMILSVLVTVYFLKKQVRTEKGEEEYYKWLGLKNFLSDFGNFSERDLPSIKIWEKFLVYSVSFGNAKELSEKMNAKVETIPVTVSIKNELIRVTNLLLSNTFWEFLYLLNISINNMYFTSRSPFRKWFSL